MDRNCAVEQFFQTIGVLAAQCVGIAVCRMGIPCKEATKDFFLCYLTRRVCLFPMPDFGFHPFGAVPTQLLDDRAGFSQIRMEPQKINAVPQWEDSRFLVQLQTVLVHERPHILQDALQLLLVRADDVKIIHIPAIVFDAVLFFDDVVELIQNMRAKSWLV